MDQLIAIVVAAFAVGAATGATKGTARITETAIADAYAALKRLVHKSYSKAGGLTGSIERLEQDPQNPTHQAALAAELKAAGVLENPEVVATAGSLLALERSRSVASTIGLNLEEAKVENLDVGNLRAHPGAIGVHAARADLGRVKIGDLEAGSHSGN